ncbi:MAG: peptidoglycan-binding protein [Nitrosomonas oligotropha]|uniref:Peptidoglycan-binding protein n=1 Tax=Nitrosomonas oligotropha TaxID=42354 RepID=A0A5C7VWE2_9PROT|nr:MAG: peptidoglycan-binding protein [Nitrosomonas oligotropha]
MPLNNAKKLLTITACSVAKDGTITVKREKFEAMINPAGYERTSKISYSKESVMGQPGVEAKYYATHADKFVLKELILDATGAVSANPLSVVSDPVPIKEQIESLKEVIYKYNGSKHEAPIVQLKWGELLFYGRVESLKYDYTLFKPSGVPLRAKVTIIFFEYKSTQEISKEAALESPDLTHLIEIKAGDTLPLLCYRVYQDCSYYLDIAKINRLTDFRNLKPGTKLRFPPLN